MRARNVAVLLTAALVVYLVLLAGRGVALLRTRDTVAVLLGVGVLLLPVLGVWIVITTWRSGMRVQRLARRLDAEGELPDVSELPKLPSGRVDRSAADEWFEQRHRELEQHRDDWRYWYRLAQAYDMAGDRRRARSTMRVAVELEARDGSAGDPGAEQRGGRGEDAEPDESPDQPGGQENTEAHVHDAREHGRRHERRQTDD